MPEPDLLQACLDELDGVDDFLARTGLAEQHPPVLLGRPGIASSLAARIAQTADSERNAPLDLFGILVERAQRDAENRGRFGDPMMTLRTAHDSDQDMQVAADRIGKIIETALLGGDWPKATSDASSVLFYLTSSLSDFAVSFG